MEKKIIFATGNAGKMREIREILKDLGAEILSMKEAGVDIDIVEDGDTFAANALIKAKAVWEKTGGIVLADDSGLVIDALNGEPGVYSARYAGEPSDSEKNIDKLLANLRDAENRKASFVTCIALVTGSEEHVFYGEISGKIIRERRGSSGFGYDSVFVPEGYEETFAEMGEEEKNKISHRARAVKKLSDFFNTL